MPNFAAVKKVIILILAVMYLGLTSGVMVNIHYCMGEIAGVNYGHPEGDGCSTCGMVKQDGCCHTDHKFVKADDDHLYAKNIAAPGSTSTTEHPSLYLSEVIFSYRPPDLKNSQYHSPPDPRSSDFRLHNCVFRI